jgi:hypothetical protein
MRNVRISHFLFQCSACLIILSATGCATHMAPMQSFPARPASKLSGYGTVYLQKATIAPAYASHGANIKAVNKIDEHLAKQVHSIYSDVKVISKNADTRSEVGKSALLISPYVEEIKWIGGAARFWVGAMAGSSAMNMRVTFTDIESGAVIAEPIFWASASAYSGPFGVADNAMLGKIAADVGNYIHIGQ